MKQYFTLILLLGSLSISFAQNRVEDFRNIKWGTDLEKMPFTAQEVEIEGLENAYVNADDDMYIGTVWLDNLIYVFSDDKRFTRVVMMGDRSQMPEINFIVKYKFGEPEEVIETESGKVREWTIGDVKFVLENMYTEDKFMLDITSDFESAENYRLNTTVSDF